MGTRRQVESAMCVFDLTIGKVINLPESIRAKVMMLYSRKDKRREFKVLGLSFPEDVTGGSSPGLKRTRNRMTSFGI